jgi:hypothetical protein
MAASTFNEILTRIHRFVATKKLLKFNKIYGQWFLWTATDTEAILALPTSKRLGMNWAFCRCIFAFEPISYRSVQKTYKFKT